MAKRKPREQSLFDNLDRRPEADAARARRGDSSSLLARRQRRGHDRQRRAARSGAVALSQLRAVGHHRARAARRARRAEAGPAPHPLHDVAAEPDRRRQAPQVRQGRRRRDGQLPPARRRGALRNARAHGAVLSRCAIRWSTAPATSARSTATAPRRCATPSAGSRAISDEMLDRDRADDRAVPAELRRHEDRAGGAAGAHPEPARQRRRPASPSAWRPTSRRTTSARSARRSSSCSTTRTSSNAQLCRYVKGPGLPHRRADSELAGGAEGDLQDRLGLDPAARHVGHRAGDAIDQDDLHRQHSLHGQQVAARRADRRSRPQPQAAAAARRQGPVDRGRAHRDRDEEGRRREDDHGVPLQAHAAADQLRRQPHLPHSDREPGGRPPRAARSRSRSSGTSCTSASRS